MNHRYDLLKWRREQLGYTFGDASKKAKLAKGTVIGAERRNSDPQASTLRKLAKCYDLDPSSLMNFNLKKEIDFPSAVVNGAGAKAGTLGGSGVPLR